MKYSPLFPSKKVEFFISWKKMKLRTNKKMRLKSLSGMTEGYRENEQGKEKQTFKWIQMDRATLQREVNGSLGKWQEWMFYKVHKILCSAALLTSLHFLSCLVNLQTSVAYFIHVNFSWSLELHFALLEGKLHWKNILAWHYPSRRGLIRAWRGHQAMVRGLGSGSMSTSKNTCFFLKT